MKEIFGFLERIVHIVFWGLMGINVFVLILSFLEPASSPDGSSIAWALALTIPLTVVAAIAGFMLYVIKFIALRHTVKPPQSQVVSNLRKKRVIKYLIFGYVLASIIWLQLVLMHSVNLHAIISSLTIWLLISCVYFVISWFILYDFVK